MRKVQRSDVLDYVTYEERREGIRREAMATKAARRVHVGDALTLLFENVVTIRYHVQEMMRTERIVREADIQHELDTYNELIGGPGELGATMLVEIPDPEQRRQKLAAWLGVPRRVYVKRTDGTRVYATIDERQVDEGKISAVHFLKFAVGVGAEVVAIGCDDPAIAAETTLAPEVRAALAMDLSPDA